MERVEDICDGQNCDKKADDEIKIYCDAKTFRDGNDNVEEEFFGAIEIRNSDAIEIRISDSQLYHPLVQQFREEPSRLVKCLSISPQISEPVDDKSVPRTLRPSKSADFNTRVHLDTNDESRVRISMYFDQQMFPIFAKLNKNSL